MIQFFFFLKNYRLDNELGEFLSFIIIGIVLLAKYTVWGSNQFYAKTQDWCMV
jgi:hypothetical protein